MTANHRLNEVSVSLHVHGLNPPAVAMDTPSGFSFRQYLENSDKQDQTQQKSSVSEKKSNSVEQKKPENSNFSNLAQMSNTDTYVLTYAQQMPGLLTLTSLNGICPGKQSAAFSVFTRAEKLRKHVYHFLSHALNQSRSTCYKSEIIFESADCAGDRYILKFSDAGYSLSIQTQTQNYADELSIQKKTFESYFFAKTGCKLEVTVSLQHKDDL